MPTLIPSGSSFSVELRVRFPDSDDADLRPTELSGALWTMTSPSLATFASAWYDKPSATSLTGNIYVTSSFGRLQLTSASLFNDEFYNVVFASDFLAQRSTLYAVRCENSEQVYYTSSLHVGPVSQVDYVGVTIGSSEVLPSHGQFWAQEFRLWSDPLVSDEIVAHAQHFESYGRTASYDNDALLIHWRLNEGNAADSLGVITTIDSTLGSRLGTGSNFVSNSVPYTKFLQDYAYIPSIDYGWNQEKVRVFSGSRIDPFDAYRDERFVSLEFNMYDALNEDISHIMSSYGELGDFIGLPMNRYREDYEGLSQMRETYFKRLQGQLRFRVFVDMLDFFDSSFLTLVERLLPARSQFRGDELIVESHMLERPKYQYHLRPIIEGRIEISGSIAVIDRGGEFD